MAKKKGYWRTHPNLLAWLIVGVLALAVAFAILINLDPPLFGLVTTKIHFVTESSGNLRCGENKNVNPFNHSVSAEDVYAYLTQKRSECGKGFTSTPDVTTGSYIQILDRIDALLQPGPFGSHHITLSYYCPAECKAPTPPAKPVTACKTVDFSAAPYNFVANATGGPGYDAYTATLANMTRYLQAQCGGTNQAVRNVQSTYKPCTSSRCTKVTLQLQSYQCCTTTYTPQTKASTSKTVQPAASPVSSTPETTAQPSLDTRNSGSLSSTSAEISQ